VRKRLAVGLTSALLVLAGGIAYASIPDSVGVIHGCRQNSNGLLHAIDSEAGQQCAGNETALNWNQSGLRGYEVVIQDEVIPSYSGSIVVTVTCPAGKRALGGSVAHVNGQTFDWPNGSFLQTISERLTDTSYAALLSGSTSASTAHKVVTCAYPN
jgi:hypothetical protein